MARHIGSLNNRLRKIFNNGLLYTIDQLVKLTGEDKQYVMVQVSRMRNPRYCGSDEPVDLINEVGTYDRIRRVGLRGATVHAKVKA